MEEWRICRDKGCRFIQIGSDGQLCIPLLVIPIRLDVILAIESSLVFLRGHDGCNFKDLTVIGRRSFGAKTTCDECSTCPRGEDGGEMKLQEPKSTFIAWKDR